MVDERTKQDALFVNLVMLFKEAALQQMGKLINPITGKVEKNLDQARFSIDTLDMLKAKTAGNLSSDLERLLDTTLIELRMNYIAEVESEGKAVKQECSSETEAKSDSNSHADSGKGNQVCCEESREEGARKDSSSQEPKTSESVSKRKSRRTSGKKARSGN